jgi:DNA-binding response OmpR family regulator
MDFPSTTPLVLVADDEPTMLELVARHLKTMSDPKLDVIEASDGEQAWRLAREHLPDLVVLDVMMPGMSGWEVCRKIREDIALAHTGVVMLTGIGENLNQITSPLYGADAYIDKPFEFGELDQKVKSALSARASQREGISRPAVNGVSGPAKSAHRRNSKAKATAKAAPAKRIAKATPAKPSAKRKPEKRVAKVAHTNRVARATPAKKGGVKKKAVRQVGPKTSAARSSALIGAKTPAAHGGKTSSPRKAVRKR